MGQRNFQPKHRTATAKKFNGRKAIDALYDYEWERYRARFLAVNPECYCCGQPADVTDHLRPHQGDVKLFKQTDNHIPLCSKHHNTVTSKFDRRHRAGDSITEKIRWLNDMRLANGCTRRVKVLPNYG